MPSHPFNSTVFSSHKNYRYLRKNPICITITVSTLTVDRAVCARAHWSLSKWKALITNTITCLLGCPQPHRHTDCYQCIACLGHSCSVERKTQQNQTKIAIQKTDSGLCQAQLQRQVLPKIPLTVADFWVSTVHLLLKISQFRKEKKAAITPPPILFPILFF